MLSEAYILTLPISPESTHTISLNLSGRSKIFPVLNNSRVKPPKKTKKISQCSAVISKIDNHILSLNVQQLLRGGTNINIKYIWHKVTAQQTFTFLKHGTIISCLRE